MTLSLDKNIIIQMLKELKRKDPHFKNFGANVHRYNLNSPLSLIEIENFESKYNISLPIDYKYFITEVGNGVAGPYYGLFRFGEQDDGHGYHFKGLAKAVKERTVD